nr:RNA polymerase sigma-70 factor [Mucilaginibacter phyllosphaerae]
MSKLNTYTDNALLCLIAQEDEAAFATLYFRYYETLARCAYKRLQNETVVEELVQDVFLNLWIKAAELDTLGNVKAYLFATLKNKVLHELRACMVVARHSRIIAQETTIYATDMAELMHSRQIEQQFELIVAELPPQCREAFKLSRVDNLSYKSIAQKMNISVNTVEKHVGKALGILRRKFKEYDLIIFALFAVIRYLFI